MKKAERDDRIFQALWAFDEKRISLAQARAPFMAAKFYEEWFHFDRTVLMGVAQQSPRWKVCVASADATLGEALGREGAVGVAGDIPKIGGVNDIAQHDFVTFRK